MLGLIFLALFIPLVIFMLWITSKVYRYYDKLWAKTIMSSLTAFVFFTLLFGDSIAGNYYLNYLCTTQGGPHVYQTVELGPEYWNEDGSAKFIYPKGHKKYGSLNSDIFKGRYFKDWYDSDEKYSFSIIKDSFSVKKQKNEILGEQIRFRFLGGWLANSIGYSVSGNSCTRQDKFFIKLLLKIFLNKNT